MTFHEEDFLQLSGLQHFIFCRRQWGLIHVEHQWAENLRTVEGELLHQRCHDSGASERRGDLLTLRNLHIFSPRMGISGACDVVEFHADPHGVPLQGHAGTWRPYPVEYKRGKPKDHQADELQLCAQAMCLEEMLCCAISEGALFYGESRRRQVVPLTDELRSTVTQSLAEMHDLYRRGHTPKVKPGSACRACSLSELCLPALMSARPVADYLRGNLEVTP